MNILIVEDEKQSANRLKKLISNYLTGKIFDLYFAETISEANSIINVKNIDLLFLDLQLGGDDGFSLIKEIAAEPFYTIVVSAFTNRAIEAFDYGVIDFIPKPVFQERVNQALDRVFSKTRLNHSAKVLVIKNRNTLESIPVENILYLHPLENYTEIVLTSGSKKLHHLSLDKIIKLLPNNFERTHRAYIVNLDYLFKISSFQGSRYEIQLKTGLKLPLGRTYAKKIKAIFNSD